MANLHDSLILLIKINSQCFKCRTFETRINICTANKSNEFFTLNKTKKLSKIKQNTAKQVFENYFLKLMNENF